MLFFGNPCVPRLLPHGVVQAFGSLGILALILTSGFAIIRRKWPQCALSAAAGAVATNDLLHLPAVRWACRCARTCDGMCSSQQPKHDATRQQSRLAVTQACQVWKLLSVEPFMPHCCVFDFAQHLSLAGGSGYIGSGTCSVNFS